jgi:hypothetical protein
MTAIKVGISPKEYDDLTPHETKLIVDVYIASEKARQREAVTLVWMGAQFQRARRLPKLETILKGKTEDATPKKPVKPMTDKQLLTRIKAMNKALGGKVVTTERKEEDHGN